MNRFRIAALQLKSASHAIEQNTATVIGYMKTASENGADILLLPECFITGYALPAKNSDGIAKESPCIVRLCRAAKKLGIGLVATALTQGDKKPRNSAFVISKDGEVLMRYDKVHTCDFSVEACLESGTEFRVCDFSGVRVGVMICYDREYPESARMLMLKGAEIILVPNDCGAMAPRVNALSTRAYENMTAVVMANPPGENAGCSCAFSPICWDKEGNCADNTLFLAGEEDTGLFFADIDLDALRSYRAEEMLGATFRKVGAYDGFLDPEVQAPFIRKRSDEK